MDSVVDIVERRIKRGKHYAVICVAEGYSDEILEAIVKLVRRTREEDWSKDLEQGASARASLSLYEKVQASALLDQRDTVSIADLKEMASSSVLGRIKPASSSQYYDNPAGILEEILKEL